MLKYKTKDLARETGIHPNTVRLYEKIGFISPVPRAKNGYRIYNERHLYQLKICRCIFDYDWLGREIRAASLKIIEAAVSWDLDKVIECTHKYLELIKRDFIAAEETAELLKRWVAKDRNKESGKTYTRKEVAKLIGVTEEVLRNWDRNGLIEVPRVGVNNTRIYGNREIERLRIIYMLRQSKYSISAILQSLKEYDRGNIKEVINALNTPKEEDYQAWIVVGDRWMKGLKNTANGGEKILLIIEEVIEKKI